MAFIDTYRDAERAVREAEAAVSSARDQQEALRAAVELAGARIALAILASADSASENQGAETS